MIFAIGILVVDYIAYKFLFGVGMGLVPTLPDFILGANVWGTLKANLELEFRYILGPPEGLPLIFFWSGFVPSIWMWLYVLALFVTRLLLRSEKLVNWLRWALGIEKNPFRSIGAVAATLAFIASVAVILVSAEIFQIGTALSG
jgi:hypothetical protein